MSTRTRRSMYSVKKSAEYTSAFGFRCRTTKTFFLWVFTDIFSENTTSADIKTLFFGLRRFSVQKSTRTRVHFSISVLVLEVFLRYSHSEVEYSTSSLLIAYVAICCYLFCCCFRSTKRPTSASQHYIDFLAQYEAKNILTSKSFVTIFDIQLKTDGHC